MNRKAFENIEGKGAFSTFPSMFSVLSKAKIIIFSTFIFLSADGYNLEQSKILLYVVFCLKHLQMDYKLALAEMMISAFKKAEKIVGKGENAGNQHFLLFSQCF